MIVGDKEFYPYGDLRGRAKIFELENGNWVQVGSDIIGMGGRNFGQSVSISSDGHRRFALNYNAD